MIALIVCVLFFCLSPNSPILDETHTSSTLKLHKLSATSIHHVPDISPGSEVKLGKQDKTGGAENYS